MSGYSVDEIRAMFTGSGPRNAAEQFLWSVPHARPGHPSWMLYTGAQWALLGEVEGHCERLEAKYGHMPSFSPTMLATMRRIF